MQKLITKNNIFIFYNFYIIFIKQNSLWQNPGENLKAKLAQFDKY